MDIAAIFSEIEAFSKETHGSSDFHKDDVFVQGQQKDHYAPLSYLKKKLNQVKDPRDLLKKGFVFDSYDLFSSEDFHRWFEKQFSRKFTPSFAKQISILHLPDNKSIFDSIEQVHAGYEVLRQSQILMNGKNLPVQLGEWYAKAIFGLRQVKSTSQRGFDFYIGNERAEVKVHWADHSSPKGVKVRKSMVQLSQYTILMYVARNFMIREICFLDSDFVLRKYGGKGHTIFLKDSDVGQYFFSRSNKQSGKVVNQTALMKYASPTFAMNLTEFFN